jgi:hypothetical protein
MATGGNRGREIHQSHIRGIFIRAWIGIPESHSHALETEAAFALLDRKCNVWDTFVAGSGASLHYLSLRLQSDC